MDKLNHWLMVDHGHYQEFTPLELNEDGSVKSIVIGMCLISTLDDVQKNATKIIQVDDMYELTNPRVVFEKP